MIQKLDLYEFLLKGTMNGNVNLMDQDVVFIPTLERKVTFQGQVKRPMIFELKADENLDEAIQFAGGFTEEAFTENIQIQRNNEKERVLLDVPRKDYKTITLKNGDQIEINAILDRYTNKVEVLGA
ncbi:MAG: SLBB domain-containing protein, partial [Cytophagaceae bacterium]|nr:SLBB domain-containing protein [Cytophagaceae bacterium]